jgi:hypothetical protein
MNDPETGTIKELAESELIAGRCFEQAAEEIVDRALKDAKIRLHPLLRNLHMDALERRAEFVRALKRAIAYGIAEKIAAWEVDIDAIYQFEESWMENRTSWDGSIHLLAKVSRLSNGLGRLGDALDKSLLPLLRCSGWSCFRHRRSILELQQVTKNELRHCISYGAMFSAVYSVPVQIWPARTISTVIG